MGEETTISWTHATFNPWRGCSRVSAGCRFCYAERMSKRNPKVLGEWGPNGIRVIASESYWRQPLRWEQDARTAGDRRRVFCASLADVFEDRPELVAPRVRLFHLINETPSLDWLLLTKRPENIRQFYGSAEVPRSWAENMPRNVWLGVSVENQATADERIPHLLKVPASVRFLSCEPLLGSVDLRHGVYMKASPLPWHAEGTSLDGIDLVIVGGESGPGARPMHPDWARSIRDQCVSAGVAFHFKQHGEWFPSDQYDDDTETPALRGRTEIYVGPRGQVVRTSSPFEHGCPCCVPPGYVSMVRVGKKAAGRLLDGHIWDEMPAPTVAL